MFFNYLWIIYLIAKNKNYKNLKQMSKLNVTLIYFIKFYKHHINN